MTLLEQFDALREKLVSLQEHYEAIRGERLEPTYCNVAACPFRSAQPSPPEQAAPTTNKYRMVPEAGLFRIYALKDFGNIKAGDRGGLVEQESNLSQQGNCWVFDNAKVWGKARVFDNAKVYGNVKVYGSAWVYDNAKVSGNARVYGNAKVSGDAKVYGDTKVWGNAEVYGNAWVLENARVLDNARVCSDAMVSGCARVSGYAKVYGNTRLSRDDEVHG